MPTNFEPIGGEFTVTSYEVANDFTQVALNGGGFVSVRYQDVPGDGVFFEVFDATGQRIRSGAAYEGFAAEPTVTSLDSGGFLIAWIGFQDMYVVRGQLFDASGATQSEAFTIDPDGRDIAVASTPDGFAALTIAANGEVTYRSYDVQGALITSEVTISDSAAAGAEIRLLELSDGTMLAGWTEGAAGLRAVHLSSDGTPLSAPFLIPQSQSVATLDGGGFVNVWTERGPSAVAADIFAQIYQADGAPAGPAFRVNETIAGDQEIASVTGIDGGGFAVSWTGQDADGAGIRARAFDSDGQPGGPEFLVNILPRDPTQSPHQNLSEISRLTGGGVLVTWYQLDFAQPDERVGRIFVASQIQEGSDGADVLIGSAYEDELYGLGGDDTLRGLAFADYLDGGAGRDLLYGGAGADVMQGGTGDDFFFVENSADRVLENAAAGYDTVFTTASFTLEAGADVEALRFNETYDPSPFDLNGNEFGQILAGNAGANALRGGGGDDYLQGNDGNDYLDGGIGNDVLIGGLGDDWYVMANDRDRIIETIGQGRDTVFTNVSFALQQDQSIEELRAWDVNGTSAMNLLGNADAQVIIGNAGVNTLDGGGGADQLIGGTGNDYYIVDVAADRIVEGDGQGYDSAFASASFDLRSGVAVEELRLSDASSNVAMNLWGNEFGQVLVGNAGENFLSAGAGNDTIWGLGGSDRLEGGAGDDVLIGGAGEDVFGFAQVGFRDRIADFVSGVDRIDLRAIDAVATDIFADNAFTWIGQSAFTGIAGQLRSYSEAGITYLAGDVTGDGGVDFLIELGSAQVQASDLLL